MRAPKPRNATPITGAKRRDPRSQSLPGLPPLPLHPPRVLKPSRQRLPGQLLQRRLRHLGLEFGDWPGNQLHLGVAVGHALEIPAEAVGTVVRLVACESVWSFAHAICGVCSSLAD